MRTIKFRGRRLGKWYYGDLEYSRCTERTIIHSYRDNGRCDGAIRVERDTIGQFTGLYDKYGKEIYEGDILLFGRSIKNVVVFRHGAFGYEVWDDEFIPYAGNTNFTFKPFDKSTRHEVIGNIHDTPELLKEERS